MKTSSKVSPRTPETLFGSGSRRDFLRIAAAGGAVIAIPSLLASCKLNDITTGNGDAATGTPLPFDFSKGDVAFLQFFYAYKLLQTDLYDRAIATTSTSNLKAAEQTLVAQIRGHLIVQRDTLKGILGTANLVTVTPTWGSVNFADRANVLSLAIQFADVGVAMWNGVAQSLASAADIGLALEIGSVEARHSAALRDDNSPKAGDTGGFAPGAQDGAYRLSTVATLIQQFIIERMQFLNAPAEIL